MTYAIKKSNFGFDLVLFSLEHPVLVNFPFHHQVETNTGRSNKIDKCKYLYRIILGEWRFEPGPLG